MPEELEEKCKFWLKRGRCMVSRNGDPSQYENLQTACRFRNPVYPDCCDCSKHKKAKDKNVLTSLSIQIPKIYR